MRKRALATILLTSAVTIVACKPAAEPSDAPESSGAAANESAAKPVAATKQAADDGVVAKVDGRPLFEKDVDRHLKMAPPGTSRQDVAITLIDRLVFEAEAGRQQIRVHEQELATAAQSVAQSNGLTVDELKRAVLEQTGMTWTQYEEEIRGQILQMKVLQLLGVDMGDGGLSQEQQRRVMLCLRARANTEVVDSSIELPDNPYDLELKVTGLTVQGKPELASKTLESAVLAGVEPGPACEVLLAVEPILLDAFLDAGYVRAEVDVQWPLQPDAEVVLTVVADAGELHRVGAIHFDQSQVAADKRADEAKLLEVVSAELKAGDVASISKMKAARDRLNALLKIMSLPEAQAESKFDDSQSGVLDLTFIIPAS